MSDMHLDVLLMQNILRNIDEGVHVVDSHGNTVYYNEAMEKIEGLRKENVIGRHVLDVFPNLDSDTSTLLKAMESGREISRARQTYLNHKGQRISSVNITIPLNQNGNVLGAVEIARNVTDFRMMSEKVADLQMRLYGKGGRENRSSRSYEFTQILGQNAELTRILEYAKKASINDSSVFIFGETGTGKELIAQSIHGASKRREFPFIAQNCAALPDSLLEGILFGTSKGGFTGAIERPGLFEQSAGGTLFLDEINSMSLHLQAKILRVLQESYLRRVGGVREIDTDVRIIAASNEEPGELIKNGFLRKDLYYRINVIGLKIPPLRERLDDINILSNHFIGYYNEKYGMKVKGLESDVRESFCNYEWPGNVRELKNVLESAMNVTSGETISKEDLPDYYRSKPHLQISSESCGMNEFLAKTEKKIIMRVLEKMNWNITEAGKELGISRQSLQYKMKKHEIR